MSPAYKQLSFIAAICKELNLKFYGDFWQARSFISNHIDEFYKHQEARQKLIQFLKVH